MDFGIVIEPTDKRATDVWGVLMRNITGTYNLLYNATLMVEEGLGYALCIDKLINTSGDSNLCFRPLNPELQAGLNIIWKKHQVFSAAASKFLDRIRHNIETYNDNAIE